MSPKRVQFTTRPAKVALALLIVAGTAVALSPAARARADDPVRGEVASVLVQETAWAGPVGTAGAPAMRAQRDAFWDQVTGRYKEYRVGKITPDLLLEADRFFLQADRECAASPGQRVAASRAALGRTDEIRAVSSKMLAAGRIKAADMSQVEGQMKLFQFQLKEDIEAARETPSKP